MKEKKIRSIKKISFYTMIKSSVLVLLVIFFMTSIFFITEAFFIIRSNQENLSEILVNNYNKKHEMIKKNLNTLAEIFKNNNIPANEKKRFIESLVNTTGDIKGIVILDKKGVVIDSSNNYKDFIGVNLSNKEYYKEIVNNKNKEYIISNSYVSYKDKKITTNIISPIRESNNLIGIIVAIVDPNIIESKNLKGIEYYLTDSNGNIVFKSNDENIKGTIKDSIINKGLKRNKAFIYKDKITNKLVIGSIKKDSISSMYIIVQYNIFSNKTLYTGLLILFILINIFVFISIILFSSWASRTIKDYINIFKDYAKSISFGEQDIKITNKFYIEEVNDIVEILNIMSDKIKTREEKLKIYNKELIDANNEIKNMITILSKNEKEKKDQYLKIIWAMVNLLEIKDEYTAGHSKAVTCYAEEISERLNKNYGFNIDVERIQIAAILHDIGKIGIDKSILNKTSKLTKEEYDIIKTHPVKGYYALKGIESLKEEREMIKYHHERFDGLGYPEGLKGDEIPLGARIICVADAFDAMVSDRPYRKGMSVNRAIAELEANKGIQFDPFIVEVFVDMIREGEFEVAQTELN